MHSAELRSVRAAKRPRTKMLACIVRNQTLEVIEKELPRIPQKWALIRVRLAGICNTDIEILRGYHAFRGTPGHEFVGEVVDVRGSKQEKSRWLGRRVTGEINIACPALGFRPVCEFCRRGLKTHCARRKVLGIVTQGGAFAEYLTLPIENLHPVPDAISDEQAVFVEPLAAACEITAQLDVRKFAQTAILGDGKLAQLIARVLHEAGPRVTVYGKHEKKLALVRGKGIVTRKLRGDSSDLKRVKERFLLVVEATGSPSGLELALAITEPRGTLVLKSTFHGTAPVTTWPIVVNELNIIGSRCGPFPEALSLLRQRAIDPRGLITRTFPLAEAKSAIEFAQRSGVMKVLLAPNS